jgi:Sensors of blue-light using FAD
MQHRIVYVSRATPGVTLRDCYDIIRTAHNRNSRLGLTGALLYLDGWFIQVLEGWSGAVHSRYEAIRRDPRHTALELRLDSPVDGLMFPGDWMALRGDQDIGAEVRQAHGYLPGLPADQFSPAQVLAFVRDCCQARTEAA